MKKKRWKRASVTPTDEVVTEDAFTAVVRVKFNNGQVYEGKAAITLPLHWLEDNVPHFLLSDAHLEEITIHPYYTVADQIQVGNTPGGGGPPVIVPQPVSVKPVASAPVGTLVTGALSRAQTRT